MIECYVPCRFAVRPKGWLPKLLLRLGLFRYTLTIWK